LAKTVVVTAGSVVVTRHEGRLAVWLYAKRTKVDVPDVYSKVLLVVGQIDAEMVDVTRPLVKLIS